MSFQDSKFNVSEDPPYDFLGSSTKTVRQLWLLSFHILVYSLGIIGQLMNSLVSLDWVRPVMTETNISETVSKTLACRWL